MLNKLAKDIHKTACDHGWWEEDRPFAEIIALCHSELSEALEEYRNDRPMIYYYKTEDVILRDRLVPWLDIENANGRKLEGIAVELADTIIRILDYLGRKQVDIEAFRDIKQSMPLDEIHNYTLPELIAESHAYLSYAYKSFLPPNYSVISCIELIEVWCKHQDIDIWGLVKLKHEFNKGRSFKHGGKKI